MASKTSSIENILSEVAETVDIDAVKAYHQNPRVGNIEAIRESLRENGQFRPIIVQRSTGEIIGGNHTWKAAKAEGWQRISAIYLDVDDDHAKRIVLADNRTNDLSTYDSQVLADILSSLPSAAGTGYDDEALKELLGSVQEDNAAAIRDIVRPPMVATPSSDGGMTTQRDNSVYAPPVPGGASGPVYTKPSAEKPEADPEDTDDLNTELGELQGILQLREDVFFPGANYYDMPDLRSDMLLETLPDPIDTWGGSDATPDDGKTTWVWNYGVASKKDLPMDRAILCFYTYDTYFESFWENPGFMTAKVLNAGIKTAVVPDYSYYTETGVSAWVWNNYRAQWVGRYFQEAGITVIPRIQYAIDRLDSASLDFNCNGIPVGAPVVAKSSHNHNNKEEFDLEVYGLRKSLEKVQPETLLIYGGNPAGRIIETLDPVGQGLCANVVHIMNYAHKRRGVVFDKKEGMASNSYRAMTRKEREKREKDKTSTDEDFEIEGEEAALAKPEKASKKKAEPEPEVAPTDEDETL